MELDNKNRRIRRVAETHSMRKKDRKRAGLQNNLVIVPFYPSIKYWNDPYLRPSFFSIVLYPISYILYPSINFYPPMGLQLYFILYWSVTKIAQKYYCHHQFHADYWYQSCLERSDLQVLILELCRATFWNNLQLKRALDLMLCINAWLVRFIIHSAALKGNEW